MENKQGNLVKKFIFFVFVLFFSILAVNATQHQIKVQMNEYVNQVTYSNPLLYGSGIGLWANTNENQSSYNITGKIIVSNENPNNQTLSDIYVSFNNTQNITLPIHTAGRNGTFISNNVSSGILVLHIPELQAGQNSTFTYYVNTSIVRPVLNLTANYSDSKILSGDNISITDNLQNDFDNSAAQTNTCIYDINLTQVTTPINFLGQNESWKFIPNSTFGPDAGNVNYNSLNETQYWNVLGGSCLNKSNSTSITYKLSSPYYIPKSDTYSLSNTTLKYKLNQTMSHMDVVQILGIGQAKLSIEKKILKASNPLLYGSNVTWNVTGHFNVASNITYNLTKVTLWVSKRNVNGSYTDPNVVDKDTISNATLKKTINPFVLVNSTAPWTSAKWLFNYSDIPTPIVWSKENFTIANDGTQLVNKSLVRNGKDIYVKELYLILGYWLEIDKNITSLGNGSYNVKINVRNKGNQGTPEDTVVTIYDFIPSNFNLTTPFSFSQSPWYNTTTANHSVVGNMTGMLYQWGLLPTNSRNNSFDAGPTKNINNSWSVSYNVSGIGNYKLVDVYVTGLDPQQVDGAGSSKTVVVSEILNKMKSTEGVFATVASVLLLFGLVL